MNIRNVLALGLVFSVLTGCGTIKNLTGQRDDTVLPGTREEVLPPDQQTARDPVVTGEKPKECSPQDPDCIPPADQEPVDQELTDTQ